MHVFYNVRMLAYSKWLHIGCRYVTNPNAGKKRTCSFIKVTFLEFAGDNLGLFLTGTEWYVVPKLD